MVSRI
ncbi:hypothetical protein F383_39037 [Gossypium arboreum]